MVVPGERRAADAPPAGARLPTSRAAAAVGEALFAYVPVGADPQHLLAEVAEHGHRAAADVEPDVAVAVEDRDVDAGQRHV